MLKLGVLILENFHDSFHNSRQNKRTLYESAALEI